MKDPQNSDSLFIKYFASLHKSYEEVIEEENNFLDKRRRRMKDTENLEKTKFGIAFSGGGIRSASVCLGATKILKERNILEKADYISSVSGGGYTNAYIQAAYYRKDKIASDDFIEKLRKEGANYFISSPSRYIPNWIMILLNVIVIMSIGLLNPLIYLSVAILAGYILYKSAVLFMNQAWTKEILEVLADTISNICNFALGSALWEIEFDLLGIILKTALTLWVIGISFYYFFGTLIQIKIFQKINKAGVYIFGIIILVCGLNYLIDNSSKLGILIAQIHDFLSIFKQILKSLEINSNMIWQAFFGVLLIWACSIIFRKIRNPFLELTQYRLNDTQFRFLKIITNISTILLGLFLFLLMLVWQPDFFDQNEEWQALWLAIKLLCLFWLMGYYTNINQLSFGRIYGDSLAKAFNFESYFRLNQLNRNKNGEFPQAPYPLFNGCLNLALEKDDPLNLTSDYFLFSPKAMGSKQTGYIKTPDNITLSRAMATSGGAINTESGAGSNILLRILIGLANLRMGSMIYNPKKNENTEKLLLTIMNNGKLFKKVNSAFSLSYRWLYSSITWWPFYYLGSLLGKNNTQKNLLDVSDGGHIENLGVFELLRRQCKLIMGIDVTMDGRYKFKELRNLIKRAEVELHIELRFWEGFNPFEEIPPQPNGFSKQRFAIADIILHKKFKRDENGQIERSDQGKPILIDISEKEKEDEKGLFLYFKSSIEKKDAHIFKENKDEKPDEYKVFKYKKFNAQFPHDTTADQNFDPVQFEAYYQLGQSLIKDFFPEKEKLETRKEIIKKIEKLNPLKKRYRRNRWNFIHRQRKGS